MGARGTITVTVRFYANKTRKQRVRERKTMRYKKREIELQEEVILPSIPFPLLVGCE